MKNKANVNFADNVKKTALHLAVEVGKRIREIVQRILQG